MKKTLFQIADYSDHRQDIFDNWFSPRNKEYAEHHGFEYYAFKKIDKRRPNPIWSKLYKIQELLESSATGDKISVIDADAVVVNGTNSFETDFSFGYAIDSGNTHCMGNFTITVNAWSRKLVSLLLSEKRYQQFKNDQVWQMWAEQASWYYLAGIERHSWTPFLMKPNFGWHGHDYRDSDRLSLDELYENVDVLPTQFNITLIEGESQPGLMQYNINPCDEVWIRHFAGGQDWNIGKEYCKKELL